MKNEEKTFIIAKNVYRTESNVTSFVQSKKSSLRTTNKGNY